MSPKPANYSVAAIQENTEAGIGNTHAESGAKLLYDSECPICNSLACSLKQDNPSLEIIDARHASAERTSAVTRGLDLNEGMAMIVDGRHYYSADALTYIARFLQAKGLTGWLMRLLFRHKRITQTLYPALVLLRKRMLRLAGRPPIDDRAEPDPLADNR